MKVILNIPDKELDIVKGFLTFEEEENTSIDDFKGRTIELNDVNKNVMMVVMFYAIGTELKKGDKS